MEVRNETWAISKLKPYPNNARKHPKDQISQLCDSMREFGQVTPILVDEDGVIIAGHGRAEAAKRAKLGKVWVAVAVGWTEEAKAKYRLLDNALGDLSDWDADTLASEIASLGGVDLGGFEFDFNLDDGGGTHEDNGAASVPAGGQNAPAGVSPGAPIVSNEDDGEIGQDDQGGGSIQSKSTAAPPIRIPILVQLSPAQNKAWNEIKVSRGYTDNTTAFIALAGLS